MVVKRETQGKRGEGQAKSARKIGCGTNMQSQGVANVKVCNKHHVKTFMMRRMTSPEDAENYGKVPTPSTAEQVERGCGTTRLYTSVKQQD